MGGKVITVAQQKGGSGKTTLAANLAISLVRQGHRVAVLDTDPQGSLGRWFMMRREATSGETGLEFATASAWGVSYEVDKLKKSNDFVIVDTPPKVDSDLRPAIRESDLVVVPVATSHLDLWATESVLEMAERERRSVLIVLNRASSRANLTQNILNELNQLDAPKAATMVGNRVAFAEALGCGATVSEGKNTPAAEEIAALTEEISAYLAP